MDNWELILEIILRKNRDEWRTVSLVCKDWFFAEAKTRDDVTVNLCYGTDPSILSRRSPNLKTVKIKGDEMMKWGCEATPWIEEISKPEMFQTLKAVHFSQMKISDKDLDVLGRSRTDKLEVLQLYGCYGFSTDGLLSIAKQCRNIQKLLLDSSRVHVKDGQWLHEISVNNRSLKVLNFYLTPNILLNPQDLELIAKHCPLRSVKIGLVHMLELSQFFKAASRLQQFFGGYFSRDEKRSEEMYRVIRLPPLLCDLGMFYMKASEISLVLPIAERIQHLDLRFALLGINELCDLLHSTPNLEVLELFTDIQDQVLAVLAKSCKKLKRLRILLGPDMKTNRRLTQNGLISVARGCQELEHIEVYILTIKNEALYNMGEHLKNLCDFRLTLTSFKNANKTLTLDDGVRALLVGCTKMRKFKLFLREGDLSDLGLKYIGRHGNNLMKLALGECGDSDKGLIALSQGCPKLQNLELRWCSFTERGIATAVMNLPLLRFLRAVAYKETKQGDLSIMTRPYWKIDLISSASNKVQDKPDELVESELLAYYSLVDERPYYPDFVSRFRPQQ